MASHHSDSIINPVFSQQHWVDQIRHIVQQEAAIDADDIPGVCVFQVPKALSAEKPEAYVPQLVAFGPNHHLRLELYQMEKYKLVALRDVLNPSQILNFDELLVDKLRNLELIIRACYQKFMEFDGSTLAWILAIDGLFLLNLLHSHAYSDDFTGKMLVQDTILTRDMMMLENQIPFILLKEIWKPFRMFLASDHHHRNKFDGDESDSDCGLFSMMLDFCEAHSPLKFSGESKKNQLNNTSHAHHLLALMYNLIVGKQDSIIKPLKNQFAGLLLLPKEEEEEDEQGGVDKKVSKPENEQESYEDVFFQNVEVVLDLADRLGFKGAEKFTKPVQVIRNVPWAKISGLFGNPNKSDYFNSGTVTLPSSSYLLRFANIRCRVVQGGIKNIGFDKVGLTLYLPEITLNASSDVILRNLVAYEVATSTSSSSLELTKYVSLMNGLIDTVEDVRLLREGGIVVGTLPNQEIADLFNGMKKSFVKSDDDDERNRSNLEITVQEVSNYFNDRMTVKAYRGMQKQVYASWKFLALISSIVILLLLGLQSFCQFYGCGNRFVVAADQSH